MPQLSYFLKLRLLAFSLLRFEPAAQDLAYGQCFDAYISINLYSMFSSIVITLLFHLFIIQIYMPYFQFDRYLVNIKKSDMIVI